MREPEIRIGFIIFNDDWKEELAWNNGHRKTAMEWIRDHNFMALYKSIEGKNGIYDEEDFLIDYIGAIKLYCYNGDFYCRLSKKNNPNASYYTQFYQNKGYNIVNGYVCEEKSKQKVLKYEYPYNATVINHHNCMIYNPYRDGD